MCLDSQSSGPITATLFSLEKNWEFSVGDFGPQRQFPPLPVIRVAQFKEANKYKKNLHNKFLSVNFYCVVKCVK